MGAEGVAAPSDEELLRRVAGADADALTRLYERHGAALFGYLYRLAGDRMTAEEILQDTLLAVWRDAASYATRSTVRTWLFGVARRQAHNRLRRKHLDLRELDEAHHVPDPTPGPETVALARLDLARLVDVLGALSALHREVLGLAFVDEMSYADMAQVLGVPVGTVKSRLSLARSALAALFHEDEEVVP